MEDFRFNTAIARLMEHSTAMQKARDAGPVDGEAWDEAVESALLLTAPLAPHITEELWGRTGRGYSIHLAAWPVADPALARDESVELAVQVNGKVREHLLLALDTSEAEAREMALGLPRVREWIGEGEPRRIIYVPGKLLNIVV
jgi:leucyl-tRNA synthetase